MIPHVTDAIKEFIFNDLTEKILYCVRLAVQLAILNVAVSGSDTQGGNEIGKQQACFVHVTLLPYIVSCELKIKPTQHR